MPENKLDCISITEEVFVYNKNSVYIEKYQIALFDIFSKRLFLIDSNNFIKSIEEIKSFGTVIKTDESETSIILNRLKALFGAKPNIQRKVYNKIQINLFDGIIPIPITSKSSFSIINGEYILNNKLSLWHVGFGEHCLSLTEFLVNKFKEDNELEQNIISIHSQPKFINN